MGDRSPKLNQRDSKRSMAISLLALLLCALALLTPALAITQGQVSGFTVQLGGQEYQEDLGTAQVVFDLYRVGTAPKGTENSWRLFDRFGGETVSTKLSNAQRLRYSRSLGSQVLEGDPGPGRPPLALHLETAGGGGL